MCDAAVVTRLAPVTTANARIGPAILDGAFPFDRAFSSRKTAGARVRAWLTSEVRQKTMRFRWKCPKCKRAFTRRNQRHACGTGERSEVLRGRPEALVALYASVELFAKSLGPIEIVTRQRYVLFRSTRIFADFVVMTDALRAAVHLGRKVKHPIFFKVGTDRNKVSHVAMLRTEKEFTVLKPYLREAYDLSVSDVPKPAQI
ncbi:MAG: hypothetical protein HY736_21315 [Verrucomicrobia bacterium]|nr:hypothetical protein [Verrucomicrobiota bacterium]